MAAGRVLLSLGAEPTSCLFAPAVIMALIMAQIIFIDMLFAFVRFILHDPRSPPAALDASGQWAYTDVMMVACSYMAFIPITTYLIEAYHFDVRNPSKALGHVTAQTPFS